MARKSPDIRMVSFGLYTPFDKASKALPRVMEFTEQVPAREGVEFGYVLDIRKARGSEITFRIDHPPFADESGELCPPFEGQEYVRGPSYEFFLGDAIWAPVEEKVGDWTLTTWLDGREVARKTFRVVRATDA